MTLTVVILTWNEARHSQRAIGSVAKIADRLFVIDSGSSDETVALAQQAGATVLTNPFVTQAQQFNWALEQLPEDTEWVLRLDADEIVTDELRASIASSLPHLPQDVAGVHVRRRMHFMRRPIRWGGVFPISVLRIFRYGQGRCEDRWMDEHIVVDGNTKQFDGELIDDNLNSLGWWTDKHNSYASREVVDILSREYGLRVVKPGTQNAASRSAGVKRWIKEKIYLRLPGGIRAFAYFIYRYVLRLGFLDGVEGAAFHFLQGFWYRFLVDMKLREVRDYMRRHSVGLNQAISDVLGIQINNDPKT